MACFYDPNQLIGQNLYTPTSGFGQRKRPAPGTSSNHKGQDYGAPAETAIPVVADGRVAWVGNDPQGYGNYVVIEHKNASDQVVGYTLYAHMQSVSVASGQSIAQGQTLGLVGRTGNATGDSLHFEVRPTDPANPQPWNNAKPINPETFPGFGGESCQMPSPDSPLLDDIASIPILEQSVLDFESAEDTVVSPIILDLDGDGVETIGVTAGAYFDHDGNGFAEQTGWAGADDGLLVWDRNGDGRINDGKELFGSETILADGTKAANGYAALAELDTNADGRVDANDAAFASLKVWKDLDGDGYSAASELISLTDAGVQSLNTGSTASTYVDPNGNAHKLTGSFTKTDGTVGQTADVWFQTDTLYTIQEEYLPISAEIAALPDLRGYGNVYDLQQAMVRM